jgi:predicted alpha/beta hydrolase
VKFVGHSSGGHSYGLMTDPTAVGAAYLLSTGSGWHGMMPRLEQLRVRLLWNTLGPSLTCTTGYLAWSHLDVGEDLPLEVYRQWKAWCRYPHYFFDDPLYAEQARAAFALITAPITAANATDDRWIPPAARDALMIGYANAPVTTIDLHPTQIGLRRLGHMGYFRPNARPLWDDVLD